MTRELRGTVGLVAAAAMAAVLAMPMQAQALTTAEGAIIGDQGFYWSTPAESWIFPHRIGNTDNRVMVQVADAPADFLGSSAPWYNVAGRVAPDSLTMGSTLTIDSVQTGLGGGFILELIEGMNVGVWLSGYNPGLSSFVSSGISATRFTNSVGDGSGAGNQTAALGEAGEYTSAIDAGRKVDLFASYWLPDLGVEAGLHLWWGSSHNAVQPDDSAGPVDIDSDSDPTTGDVLGVDSADDQLDIDKSSFGMSDFGLGLGAGYSGLEGLHADLGFDINMLGVSWEPNAVSDYADIGGFGFGVNLRGHFDLNDKITVGGFARYNGQSRGFEPKRQRDGGDLPDLWTPADPGTNIGDPQDATPTVDDPASTNNEALTGPVAGLKYEESSSDMQVAGLINIKPNSRAKVYAALGWSRLARTTKTSIGSDWYDERSTRASTLPFVHVGFEGTVFSWLNLYVGAYKRWEGTKSTTHAYDDRIPDNGDLGQAAAGTTPPRGVEGYTNANRRDYEATTFDRDTSRTRLMLGTRMYYGPLQIVGHLDPTFLLRGFNFISGASGNLNLWVSLIYDWDYDSDTGTGNGTMMYSPHTAEPAAGAPPPAPEAEPVEESFDS